MSANNAGQGGSESIGVGAGNDPGAETQQGSGGSGGSDPAGDQKGDAPSNLPDEADVAPEGSGSAATAATRGPQDTHSRQAGSTATGLGAPEAGANQQQGDLAPPRP
ncbi:MAG: hypothetical protein QFF03_08320 [Pseudomonadota bacterium]|nr:hypothetical protein [Pseudomonadota bacterium]